MTDNKIDIDDLVNADQEAELSATEEVKTSGLDNAAADADALDTDEENLNDDAESEDEDASGEDDSENEDEESDDEDGDDDEEAGHGKRNSRVEKRIAKEVSKRKALESELKSTADELSALRDKVAELEGSNGKILSSEAEIRERREQLLDELDQIEDAIDDGGYTTSTGRELSVKDLKRLKRGIRRELDDALPAAQRRLERQRTVNRTEVANSYPSLLNESSADAKEAQSLLAKHPSLKSDPEALLMIGDMLRGRKLRMRIPSQPNNQGKGTKRPRPPESRSPNQATRSVRQKKAQSEDKQLLEAISEHLS